MLENDGMDTKPLLQVEGLKKYYTAKSGIFSRNIGEIRAVDGVSFSIHKGETLGLVGESGCGKSTLGRQIVGLEQPTGGRILYKGRDLSHMRKPELKAIRTQLQMVFQDSYSSLNPRKHIFEILAEPMLYHGLADRNNIHQKVEYLLDLVGLAKNALGRYPHEFSGGQRQRIGIARALCINPELVICDEAVSALDVSIQAQVLNLLKKLKEERNLTYIFITHDLSVVEYISDRIAVMYLGRIVELAEADELYRNTVHPYTQALLSAIPVADIHHKKKRIILEGDVPSPMNPPSGCHFHGRCSQCQEICKNQRPELKKYDIDGREHYVACHFAEENIKHAAEKRNKM